MVTLIFDMVKFIFEEFISFKGRACRRQYWSFQLFYIIVCLFLMFAIRPEYVGFFTTLPVPILMFLPMPSGIGFFPLLALIPDIAVTIRRGHDIGYSGKKILSIRILFWLLGCLLVTNRPALHFRMMRELDLSAYLNFMYLEFFRYFIINLIFANLPFIYLFTKDSQPGENKWGENPKGITNAK